MLHLILQTSGTYLSEKGLGYIFQKLTELCNCLSLLLSLAFVSFVLMTNSVSIAGHMRSGKKTPEIYVDCMYCFI